MKRLVLVMVGMAMLLGAGSATARTAPIPPPNPNHVTVTAHPADDACWNNFFASRPEWIYGDTYAAVGTFGPCGRNVNLELEVCLQQLLQNGWNVINWSCVTYTCGLGGPACGGYEHVLSHWVGLTGGRWYDSWQWGYINGESGVFSRTWDGVLG